LGLFEHAPQLLVVAALRRHERAQPRRQSEVDPAPPNLTHELILQAGPRWQLAHDRQKLRVRHRPLLRLLRGRGARATQREGAEGERREAWKNGSSEI